MNFKFNKDSSLEEELEEEFEEAEEIEEVEEVVEQLKSDSLKDMFPLIEDLKNKLIYSGLKSPTSDFILMAVIAISICCL